MGPDPVVDPPSTQQDAPAAQIATYALYSSPPPPILPSISTISIQIEANSPPFLHFLQTFNKIKKSPPLIFLPPFKNTSYPPQTPCSLPYSYPI